MSAKRIIFLIGGRSKSGKDTLADYIRDKYRFTKYAFADELKKYTALKYDIENNIFFTQQGKSDILIYNGSFISYRDLLIKESIEKKILDKYYWAKKVSRKLYNNENVVISDFRFEEEYDHICSCFDYYNSDIVTINVYRKETDIPTDEPSESSLKSFKFDYTLENFTGKKGIMFNKFDEIISSII